MICAGRVPINPRKFISDEEGLSEGHMPAAFVEADMARADFAEEVLFEDTSLIVSGPPRWRHVD